MKRRVYGIGILGAIVLACVLVLPAIAYAVEGSVSTATVYGKHYQYSSGAYKNSSYVWGGVSIHTTSGTVPAGYMGTCPRLYYSNGALAIAGPWYYTDSVSSGFGDLTPFSRAVGTFYGRGQVRMYNGNGYTTYTSTASPNIQRSSASPIRTNDSGQTFGSGLYFDERDLDYIEAVGINGLTGYVKTSDLDPFPIPNTPSEAVALQAEASDVRVIPVYDYDGTTVIDEFVVQQGEIVELGDEDKNPSAYSLM